MQPKDLGDRSILQNLAEQAMLDRGLLPAFPGPALAELDKLQVPAEAGAASIRDLRDLLWISIDNDDSRDLDQLTVDLLRSASTVWLSIAA